MEQIVSVERGAERAQQAGEQGVSLVDAQRYAAESQAGQLFVREYLAAQAKRSAPAVPEFAQAG